MRTRTREVQIFNMSLIDILCGALGAFCFMMLVLLPYYKPPASASDLQKEQAKTQDLLKELEKLKDATKDSALAQQMAEVMRQLEAQMKQLQGSVNQLTAQNQQLKAENQNLTARNEGQTRQLDMRHPFLTVAAAYPPKDIDLYLQSDNTSEDNKTTNPPFDLTKLHQYTFWSGDLTWWWWSGGVTVWMTRDAPVGVHYKVYVKRAEEPEHRDPTIVNVVTRALGEGFDLQLGSVPLTAEHFWELLGTLKVEAAGKLTFKEATPAERDAEWSKLSKGTPPPAPPQPSATGAPAWPFSNPAPQRSPAASGPEQQRAALEKLLQDQSLPEEERARIKELLERQRPQQQQSPPTSRPSASP